MKRPFVTICLAISAATAAAAAIATGRSVRKEVQSAYNALAKADEKGDIKAYLAILTPDFKLKYLSGKFETCESLQNQFSMRSKNDPSVKTSFSIESLTSKGPETVVIVTRQDRWSYTEKGVISKIEKVMKYRATWVKTKTGWKLRLEDELEESKMYEIGKPLK